MVKKKPQKRKESVWTQAQPKEALVRVLPQVQNTISKPRDASRPARLPGKRVSKNGKVYWETRSNRSDRYPRRPMGKKL